MYVHCMFVQYIFIHLTYITDDDNDLKKNI